VSAHGHIGLIALGAVFPGRSPAARRSMPTSAISAASPFQRAWLGLVLPALLINYFGQGALVLAHPSAIENPFYRLVPEALLLPLVVLATAATVIASQAVITGAYSLVRQAIQLGLLPRLAIVHTSAEYSGQIYSARQTAVLIGVLLLVGLFRTSSALARPTASRSPPPWWSTACWLHRDLEAVALAAWMAGAPDCARGHDARSSRQLLKLSRAPGCRCCSVAWCCDPDLAARHAHPATKPQTEVPLGRCCRAWKRSRRNRAGHRGVLDQRSRIRADRAVAQPQAQQGAARAERHPHHHHRDTPRAREEERVTLAPVSQHFMRVALRFGYMETPNVPKALAIARKQGWHFDIMSTSFFLSRRALKPAAHSGMPRWQDRLFIGLAKSASDATDFFQIPTGRVVEIGTQVTV
jgi:KUP system potassium uptake protein